MAKSGGWKVNPRRQPRTQADVDKAFDEGYDAGLERGMENALLMTLWVLKNDHNGTKEEIGVFNREFNDLADSIARSYVKWKDIRKALVEEYDVHLKLK